MHNNIGDILLFEGGSVMVWGGISVIDRPELHFLNDSPITTSQFNAIKLDTCVVQYVPYIDGRFVRVCGSANLHKTRCVTEYVVSVQFITLDWPAHSQGLTLIEHIWCMSSRWL